MYCVDSAETLCSPVLVSFGDADADDVKLIDFSPSGTQHFIYTKGHVMYRYMHMLYMVCSTHA